MKNFKKVISLVLVIAMLASFAGMTGFTAQAAFLELQATTNMLEFKAGDFTVKMPTVLYKTRSDGTENYHSDGSAVADDYVILPAYNPNMNFSITPPSSGVAKWEPQISINGSAYSGWWGGQEHTNTVGRSDAWKQDYSYLLTKNSWGALRGKGGYYSVPQIRWRIAYIPSGSSSTTYTHFTDEWNVNLQFWTDKPFDTKSGVNAATIDAPTVLYKNTNADGSILSSASSVPLDTVVDIWVPSNTSYASLTAVTENDTDIIGINTKDNPGDIKDLGVDSTGKKHIQINFAGWAANGMTEETKRDRLFLRFEYTVPDVKHTPYNYHSNNILDTKNSADELIPNKSSPYLESKYGDYGDKTVADTVTVTYTQYMAMYIRELPKMIAGFHTEAEYYDDAAFDAKSVISFYQRVNIANLFTYGTGIFPVVTMKNSSQSILNFGTSINFSDRTRNTGTVSVGSTDSGGIFGWYQDTRKRNGNHSDSNAQRYFAGDSGYGNNGKESNFTLGAKIYYDPLVAKKQTTTTTSFTLLHDFTQGGWCDGKDYNNLADSPRGYLYDVGKDQPYEYFADTSSWKTHVDGNGTTLSATPYSNSTVDNGAFGTGSLSQSLFNSGLKVSGSLPGNTSHEYTGDSTLTFTIDFSKLSDTTPQYARFATHYWTDERTNVARKAKVEYTCAAHIDLIPSDRSTEHAVINAAISKNYVKAEMDSNWWANYRSEVFNAYILCGDLTNATGIESVFDNQMLDGKGTDAPSFVTADFSALEAAILAAPKYDRGTSQRDVNITGKVAVGSMFFATIGGSSDNPPADPANGATYYNNDTAGNGVNNIDNASLYRYSGAYFYTEETWKTYAIERYYALNIRKFPSSSVDIWWYGAGYMPSGYDTSLSKVYIQSHIDAATTRLTNAFNALKLKKLDEFKMRNDKNPSDDYDGDGVADNVTAGNGAWVYDSNGKQVIGYNAIMSYLAGLIPRDTYTYYTELADNNGNGKLDALDLDGDGYIDDLNPVTAPVYNIGMLDAMLSQMQTKFSADQTVVDMGLEFEAAIENFLALVEITKRNPNTTDSSIWDIIFNKMRTNLGNSTLEIGDLVGVLKNEYNLTDTDAVITNINAAISQYSTFNLESTADVGQETFNTIAESFYTALHNEVTAKKIDVAATEALKATEGKFTVYNPYNLAAFGEEGKEHSLYEWNANLDQNAKVKDGLAYVGKYTQDSIDDLKDVVTAAKGKGYNIFTTSVADNIVADADKLLAQAGVKTVTGVTPILVGAKANFTVLMATVAEAEALIAGSRLTVTNYNGATAPHNRYTANSIAELIAVVNLANDYIDANNVTQAEDGSYIGKNDYSTQLDVDKLVFQIQDEMYDDRRLVNIALYDAVVDPNTGMTTNVAKYHFAWAYTAPDVDGVVTATPTANDIDFYDTNKWATMLNNEIKFTGHNNGLVNNTAYYGFLEEELKTPFLLEGGVRVDGDYSVWNEDGWAVLGADGKVPSNTLFDTSWGRYQVAYDNAMAAYKNQNHPATEEGQATINELARILAEERAQLKIASYGFEKDPNYEAAKEKYEELKAYIQKTDITRYGYVTVDVLDENGKKIGTKIEKSDNPFATTKESVYIYSGITPVIEAGIAEFYAKYASTEPSELVGSYDAAVALYESIKALIDEAKVTLKTTDAPEFYAGMNDLITNYVAGDWDGTAFTSNILDNTEPNNQVREFKNRFDAAQAYIGAEINATAEFGGDLGAATNQIFNYATKTKAVNMQFAAAMRAQVEGFMNLEYDVGAVEFYNGGVAIGKQPVFKQDVVESYEKEIADFFDVEKNPDNWPLIYEVNNLVVTQDASTQVYTVATYPSGGASPVEGNTVDSQIKVIEDKLGATSSYYTNILGETNGYYTDALKWIYQNATINGTSVDDNTTVYVLADLQPGTANASAATSAAGKPINYDVLKKNNYWYTEGYGTEINSKKYYKLYDIGDNSSWFSNYASVFEYVDKQVTGNAFKVAFGNDAVAGNMTSATILESGFEEFPKIAQYHNGARVNLSRPQGWNSHIFAQLFLTYGWNKQYEDQFILTVSSEQAVIDSTARNYYDYIQALTLLPALDAYRDVEELYWWSQGKKVIEWAAGANSYQPTYNGQQATGTTGRENTIFFNGDYDTFLKRLGDNYDGPMTDLFTTKYPYYLTTLSSFVINYDKETDQWQAFTDFMNDFHGEAANGKMLTIDMADQVNKVDATDDIKSKKEDLIELLQTLTLPAFNFDDLNDLISAFFENGNSAAAINNLAGTEFGNTYGLKYPSVPQVTEMFFTSDNYTTESLQAVATMLLTSGVITQSLYQDASDKNFVTNIDFNPDNTQHAGVFYTTPSYDQKEGQEAITAVTEDLAEALSNLVLKRAATDHNPSDTAEATSIDDQVAIALNIVNNLHDMYETSSTEWGRYLELLYGKDGSIENPAEGSALYVQAKCKAEDGYYTKALHQTMVNELAAALAAVNLPKKADKTAPKVNFVTDMNAVNAFYGSNITDGQSTNSELIAEIDPVSYDAEGNAKPATGTFFMPGSNGDNYSILVYTNELNPRLLLEVQDSSNGMIESTKNEFIDIYAKRTAQTTAGLIYGTRSSKDQIVQIAKADVAAQENGAYVFKGYESFYDKPAKYEGDTAYENEESSVFAILAPTFNTTDSVQMAQYFITVRDSAGESGGSDNYTTTLDMGEGDLKEMYTAENTISIYIYYNNAMPNEGDEGIKADGTKAEGPAETVSVMLSGEPGFKGDTWRNDLALSRSFTSLHRVWEYVAPVMNSSDMKGVPVYNDPTFRRLNTGSFYYVIKRTAAEGATAEQRAIDEMVLDAYGAKSETGKMDYQKATAVKELLIDYINGEVVDNQKMEIVVDGKAIDIFGTMQASDNFYPYGDYERDETTGEILYFDGDRADEPKWINWTQMIGNKVDNGDLVFVHVVDRWGNVVNRIVEITKLDKAKPVITAAGTGAVTINETGGSGIANIQIWNGMNFEDVSNAAEYEIFASNTQKTEQGEDGKVTVSCSNNVFTVSGLRKGGRYYLDIYDKAGSVNHVTITASAEGTISFTIIDEENNIGTQTNVESGEEGVIPQSMSFTLNGTDTIILNAGKESSVINAGIKGNVPANRTMIHYITTRDNVTQLKLVDETGAVEEWNIANEEIVDNGDGTLTWALYRKMTEGEHNYKVYAMVGGEYESFYATATITATSRYVTLTYMASGMGAVSLQYSGTEIMTPNTYQSIRVPYGAEVTLYTKVSNQDCDFYYWVNRNTDRIISTADNYSFRAVTDGNVAAQFTSRSTFRDGEKLIVYVNNAKNVVKSFQLADGEDFTVPTGPILPDYAFRGWSMTKEEILASDKETIVVEPIYVLNAENTVTITQGNYTATGDGTYTAEDNQRAVVSISASATDNDGNAFLYWFDEGTGEVVTYDRTYTFFCVKDTVLTPVYGDISARKVAPVVRITEVRYSALSGKVSFFAERSVPEEFTILQTGIVVTKTEAIGTNEDVFVVDGASTSTGTSTNTENNGFYSANALISTGQTIWARAYVIYETEDGEILEAYGPVASYSVN